MLQQLLPQLHPEALILPNNVVAVWVEDSIGNFVKTIGRRSSVRSTSLINWTAKSGGASVDTDGLAGASRSSHTGTFTFNLKK